MGGVVLVLLDTCALLWWTLDPDRLSEKARQVCDSIHQEGAFISSVSVWEIGIKMQKGLLEIGESLSGYVSRLKSLSCVEIIAVDEEIWIQNILIEWQNRDPADRTIVATALIRDLPIMTKDQIILDYYSKTIW
ncbi:MAG: type II toxin-antitoxin system VapC family toxin [bacterium]